MPRNEHYALAIHGGAGLLSRAELTRSRESAYRTALEAALRVGQHRLAAGDTALATVQTAVAALEDDPLFNAGRGAVLTRDGTVELDAAIMDGDNLRAGAVACVRRVKNPIHLARQVLERSPHVLLVSDGAERLAAELGLEFVPNQYFITAHRQQQLAELQRRAPPTAPHAQAATLRSVEATAHAPPDRSPFGTVGAVARDLHGRLAAATSTGGLCGKYAGRIGDSPIIGAGTYADSRHCAVSMTGHGEWFLRTVQAYDLCAQMHYGGRSLAQAAAHAVHERLPSLGADGGLIAIDRSGEVVMLHNTAAMFRASVRSGESPQVELF